MKKLISFLLAFVMLFSAAAVSAWAEAPQTEQPQASKAGGSAREVFVNPLYADVLSEDDILSLTAASARIGAQAETQADQYHTLEEGVLIMREQMKARATSFTLRIVSTSSSYRAISDILCVDAMEHTGVPTEGDYLRFQYGGYSYWVSYDYRNGTYYYTYDFDMAYYTSAEQEKTMDKAIAAALKELNLSGQRKYLRIKAIYDYVMDNCTYDYDNLYNNSYLLQYTAYGALVDHTAVCQGYAVLLYRLMLESDIDCRVVTSEEHAWNIAQLNGKYYDLDSTWEDTDGYYTYEYFLQPLFNDSVYHIREYPYNSDAFNEEYPMATEAYNDATMGYGPETIRIYGSNRYRTSLLLADALKSVLGVGKFDSVILASGENFPDALTGSYLAAEKNAPILLVKNSTGVVKQAVNYIKANLSAGGTVYILGGTNSVDETIETQLQGYTIRRLAGNDRYQTNIAILREADVSEEEEILVAQGTGYADSLSISSTGKPILLVGSKLTNAQKAFLSSLVDTSFTVIGGTNSVSDELARELAAYGTVNGRIAGSTRYETSTLVAEKYFPRAESLVLAYAQNYPDGLCAGPLAYTLDAPVVLVTSKNTADAASFVDAHTIRGCLVIGGASMISDKAVVKILGLSHADMIGVITA